MLTPSSSSTFSCLPLLSEIEGDTYWYQSTGYRGPSLAAPDAPHPVGRPYFVVTSHVSLHHQEIRALHVRVDRIESIQTGLRRSELAIERDIWLGERHDDVEHVQDVLDVAETEVLEMRSNAAGVGATGLARAGVVGPAGAGAAGPARAVVGGNGTHEISGCANENKVKFSTCTLQGRALTWCNGYVQTMGFDAAYLTPWTKLKEMMTAEYYSRNEIQKIKQELWNLIVKGDDISGKKSGNVTSSKPATTHDAIRMAHNLMDQVVCAKASRSSDGNKRKWEDHQGGNNNNHHHQQNRMKEVVKAYDVAPAEGMGYVGTLPLCHQSKDCMSKTPATGSNTQLIVTCYGCGEKGHYKNKCPKRKDQLTEGARGRAYVIRNGEPQ
ncbi:putative reverse transcriptase domain-containing protein [Tanacetum coccineum]